MPTRSGKRIFACGVAIAILAGVACGGGSTGPSQEQVTGTWNATSMVLNSSVNSSHSVDLIAAGGTATLTLSSDGTYTFVTSTQLGPVGASQPYTDNWSSSDGITLNLPNGNWQFDATLSGNTLTLAGGHTEWDFGTGLEEALMTWVFTRQ